LPLHRTGALPMLSVCFQFDARHFHVEALSRVLELKQAALPSCVARCILAAFQHHQRVGISITN
jgi:hypothetical protein